MRLPLIQGKNIRFIHYSTEQGLSQSRVDRLLQDAQGFLWIGTYNGLNRFDGYRFQTYKPEANNPNSLGGTMIHSLFQDRSGMLWIGVDQGLDRFDPITQTFTHFNHNADDPESLSGHVEHITQDRDGMLWLATQGGLERLDPVSLHFTHYRNDPNDARSLSSNDVRYVFEDRQGALWVATAAGPEVLDRGTGKLLRRYSSPYPSETPLDRILEDRSGTIWFSATRRGGIASLDRKTGEFTIYSFFDEWPGTPGLRGCSAMLEDQHGTLWLATYPDGVLKFDRQRREFIQYRNDVSNPNSLDNNNALSLIEDAEGGIWVGTFGGGVSRFSSLPSVFTIYRPEPGNTNSLSRGNVFSAFEDSQGTLWIGMDQLNRLDRKTGRFTFYRHEAANSGSIGADNVYGIVEDRAGILWFGTFGGGLNRFDRKTGRFKAYRHDPANPASLSHDYVRSLLLDHEGHVWTGTEDGLNRMDMRTGRFTVYRFNGPIDGRIYRTLAEDGDGSIWMGTFDWGLERLDVRTGKIVVYMHDPNVRGSLSNNRVNALCVDHSGTLWVGTQDGLDRFDRHTGEFTVFNQRDGLPNNSVEGILEDADGHLWLSTGNGLSKFDPHSNTFKNYYARDGLAGDEFNDANVYFKSGDGKMFFGGVNGVTAFYPDQMIDNPYVPPIVLTDFRLFNNPVRIGEHSVLRKAISFTDALTLSHEQSIFSFEFASLSYAAPQRNRYRYMLEGLEKIWNEVDSSQRLVTYTTLAPGRYTFRVQGSSGSGVWNVNGVSMAITILPPWYQSMWFRATCAAMFLAMLLMAYQLRVRQLRRQFDITVEARVGERTRIARELHDTLLQSFHGLLLQFRAASQLLQPQSRAKQILDTAINRAADAIAESRKTVQGLRTSTVEGRDLGKAIRTVGEELASANASGEALAFQVQGVGPRRDLRALVHDEVYRIAVEALRNAFQHAGAKRITVETHYEPREFRLSVSDDGRGIDAQVLQGVGLKGHFGLPGMRERATIIGGKLDVWSSVGEGTEINLTIPGTKAYSGADERPWWSGKLRKEKDESKAAKTTQ